MLSALDGKLTNGTWKVRFSDTAALDTGTVGCVTLELSRTQFVCCSVAGTPPLASTTLAIGEFRLRGLPPGNYKILAFSGVPTQLTIPYRSADFLTKNEARECECSDHKVGIWTRPNSRESFLC